jgi:flagellar export protein FliJ
MRQFRFRLERLLEIRRYIEKEWETRLAEKTGLCQTLRGRIQDTQRLREESFHGEPPLELSLLASLERFRSRLEQERLRLERELEQRMREREEVLRKYREVSRARKVLDKLKEKKAGGYYQEQRREETRLLDEIAVRLRVPADPNVSMEGSSG